ncbi:MAG: hypothetical protein GY945_12110 [Rhodobacteraceae bacterium]|nr:hypothetical protein [Paracoccaceae bacterium]
MSNSIKKFASEESGNAIIDWTVLMAGLVLMALAVVSTVTDNVEDITKATSVRMEAIEINPI